MKDLIKSTLDSTQRAGITTGLTALEQLVAAGNLAALTAEQRSKYGAINEQNKLLVNKTRDYRANAPQLSSLEVDWTEFASDYEMRSFYETTAARFRSLASQFESAKILHDNDNYHDALDDYAYTQYKAGAGTPGAAEKAAELKQFFPRTAKNPAVPQTPENP
jgi:hypothetical protein